MLKKYYTWHSVALQRIGEVCRLDPDFVAFTATSGLLLVASIAALGVWHLPWYFVLGGELLLFVYCLVHEAVVKLANKYNTNEKS